jgi:hypothetical protein
MTVLGHALDPQALLSDDVLGTRNMVDRLKKMVVLGSHAVTRFTDR